MTTTRKNNKATTKHHVRSPQSDIGMELVQQVVAALPSLPKGSEGLRKLRNAVWKKIAEPDIPDEAVTDMRDHFDKYGREISQKTYSRVRKEYKEKKEIEESA